MSSVSVCRHLEGSWNGVSSDQFGEQTAIHRGMVAGWINFFPLPSTSQTHIYTYSPMKESENHAGESATSSGPRHKEEEKKRRETNADRRRISLELSKMSHPLENPSQHIYNIANGRIAPPEANANVADSVDIYRRENGGTVTSIPPPLDSMQPFVAS